MKMLLQDTSCPNFYPYILYILRNTRVPLMLLAIILTASTIAGAQTTAGNGKISGTILNEAGKPMEFATVSLLRAKDSSIVKGALANEAGLYVFDRIANGDYMIAATAMGYKKATGKAFTVSDAVASISVPALAMQPESRTLNTVTVTASKPLIERKIDRTVMNVENSILATGNNALEILERAPGVTVDKDDNISLKGKQGVTVMINDKLTYLSAAQLASMLRSTDGSTIQSIEVITNPSSKYDASGNSGIINIKTKKNKQSGTNGSISATAAMGRKFRDYTSLNLNHKTGDWNFFTNLSRGDDNRLNYMNIKRVVTQTDGKTFFDQDNDMAGTEHYNNYRAGFDVNTSKRNTLGVLVNGYFSTELNDTKTSVNIGSQLGGIDSVQRTTALIDQSYKNFAVNLNDKFVIDTLGQELSVDLDYSKFRNGSDGRYRTNFFLANGTENKSSLGIINITPSVITINTVKADYVKPLSKTMKFETGFKYSSVKTDNDLQAQVDSIGEGFINDKGRSNRFIYDEKISAAYFNLSKEFKNTSVQLGLRAEQTRSNGDLNGSKDTVKRSYLNFFPTLFINQKLGQKHELGLSYSRRIDRPNYGSLNPFIYYLDQYTYNQGNPLLKPQFTNAFELNYTYNKTINVSLGYSHTSDVIMEVILTDTVKKATFQTNQNFTSQDSYSLTVNSPYNVTKWWTGNINFTGFYNKFKTENLLGGNLNSGKAAFEFKLTQTFTFAGLKSEVLLNYQSRQTYGLYDIKQRYSVDAGVSKSFFNKKLNVKASVSDIFYTRRNNIDSFYQTVDLRIRQRNDSRVGRLSFTYNFGNTKIQQRERKTGADEEAGRVRGG